MAETNFLPRTVPLLLMVAGAVVAPRHLARPVESMLVLPGAEVDHVPTVSGASGQSPLTLETVANWTWSSGGAARWSEMALKGDTMAVMLQLFCGAPPQPADTTLRKIAARNNNKVFMRHRLAALILYLLHGCGSPCFVSCATPVKHQASANKRGGAANKFGFKQSFVLSARRNRRQNHRACSNKECK